MTFKDVLKESLVNGIKVSEMGLYESLMILFFSFLIGCYLFVVYRLFVRKTLYNVNFNIALVGMTVVTTAIMLTIQSNLILSLGMVGALSIVRYRTAVKDPMDLFFLFWAIAGGIMCGANQMIFAMAVTLILTIAVFTLGQLPAVKSPVILVVNGSRTGLEPAVKEILDTYAKNYKIKSRSIKNDMESMIIELRVKDEAGLIDAMNGLEQVVKVSLLTYEGDVVC